MNKKILSMVLSVLMVLTMVISSFPVIAVEKATGDEKIDTSGVQILKETYFNRDYHAINAFNGTRTWEPRWLSKGYPAYFVFQLSKPYIISKMSLYVERANEAPQHYKLLRLKDEESYLMLSDESKKSAYLADMQNWEQVAEQKNPLMNTEVHTEVNGYQTPTSIYRFEVLKGNNDDWVNVCGLELYGHEKAVVDPKTVTLLGNNGTDEEKQFRMEKGSQFTLPDNPGFTVPKGNRFIGWVFPDKTLKFPGDIVEVTENMSIKALYKKSYYVDVHFDAGGGDGFMNKVMVQSGSYVLPECHFEAPEGFRFAGWQTSDKIIEAGKTITLLGNITLKATYVKTDYVRVTFDGNGAEGQMKNLFLALGSSYTLPSPQYVFPGKGFAGWMINGVLKHPGESITLSEDFNLIATWSQNKYCFLTIHPFGGSGSSITKRYLKGEEIYVESKIANFYPPKGKTFDGFLIEGKKYGFESRFIIDHDMEAETLWKTLPEAEGKVAISDKIVTIGHSEGFRKFPDYLFDGDQHTGFTLTKYDGQIPWAAFEAPLSYELTDVLLFDGGGIYTSKKIEIQNLKDLNAYRQAADKNAFLNEDSNWISYAEIDNSEYKPLFSAPMNGKELSKIFRVRFVEGAQVNPDGFYLREIQFFGEAVKTDAIKITCHKGQFSDGTTPKYTVPDRWIAKGEYVLPNCPFDMKKGYAFKGWQIGDSILQAGATVNLDKDTELTALYEERKSIEYLDENGRLLTLEPDEYTVVTKDTHVLEGGFYYVPEGATIDLSTVTMTITGDSTLILGNSSTLKVHGLISRYTIPLKLTVTACSQDRSTAGKLISNSDGIQACGIGGELSAITINGGNIEAVGSTSYAGIGGDKAEYKTDIKISINGGFIKAVGGYDAPGIGSSSMSSKRCDLIINGGEIHAVGTASPALGVGTYSEEATFVLTMNGGDVTVENTDPRNHNISIIGGSYDSTIGNTLNFHDGTLKLPNQTVYFGVTQNTGAYSEINISKVAASKITNIEKIAGTNLCWSFYDAYEINKDRVEGEPLPLLLEVKGGAALPKNVTFEFSEKAAGPFTTTIPTANKEGVYSVYVLAKVNGIGTVPKEYRVSLDGSVLLTGETTTLSTGKWIVAQNLEYINRLEIKGDVVLHLNKGVILNAKLGIHVPKGSSLTVEGEGTLRATQLFDGNGAPSDTDRELYRDNAVIGSNKGETETGDIYIKGGIVEVFIHNEGFNYGAGIGGAMYSSAGKIYISAGKVSVKMLTDKNVLNGGAFIGSGFADASCGNSIHGGDIVISGGVVEAYINIDLPVNHSDDIGGGVNVKNPGSFSTGTNGNAIIITKYPIGDRNSMGGVTGMFSINKGASFSVITKGSATYVIPEYNGSLKQGEVFKGWMYDNQLVMPGEEITFTSSTVLVPCIENTEEKMVLKENSAYVLKDGKLSGLKKEDYVSVNELLSEFTAMRDQMCVKDRDGRIRTDNELVQIEDQVVLKHQDQEVETAIVSDITGDLNGDSIMNIQDVTVLLNYLTDAGSVQLHGDPDLSGDGKIDIQDVTALLNILSK